MLRDLACYSPVMFIFSIEITVKIGFNMAFDLRQSLLRAYVMTFGPRIILQVENQIFDKVMATVSMMS